MWHDSIWFNYFCRGRKLVFRKWVSSMSRGKLSWELFYGHHLYGIQDNFLDFTLGASFTVSLLFPRRILLESSRRTHTRTRKQKNVWQNRWLKSYSFSVTKFCSGKTDFPNFFSSLSMMMVQTDLNAHNCFFKEQNKQYYQKWLVRNCWKLVTSSIKCTYFWSIETNEKSSLCFDLNIFSLCGISSILGGPNGVQNANRAKGGSSIFLFWPCKTLTFPRMSRR